MGCLPSSILFSFFFFFWVAMSHFNWAIIQKKRKKTFGWWNSIVFLQAIGQLQDCNQLENSWDGHDAHCKICFSLNNSTTYITLCIGLWWPSRNSCTNQAGSKNRATPRNHIDTATNVFWNTPIRSQLKLQISLRVAQYQVSLKGSSVKWWW